MPDVIETKGAATRSWYLAVRDRYPSALVPDWQAGTTASGDPLLSARVIGEHAAQALQRFAVDDVHTIRNGDGDQRPVFEYRPGRVVCVWRTRGVWVELWHPDTPAVPTPTPAVMPKRLGGLFPSGRLPFPRRDPVTVIKEN